MKNKEQKQKTLISLSKEIYRQAQAQAEKERRTLSAFVEFAIEERLKKNFSKEK